MTDLCDKCGKPISDEFNKTTQEQEGKLYEFHSECFDIGFEVAFD